MSAVIALYSADATNLYTVDPATAVETVVGPHGLGVNVEALCYCHVTKVMYGVTYLTGAPLRSKLFTINLDTGLATVVGTFPTNGLVFEDIAINRSSGQMYGISGTETPTWGLYTIDKLTAIATGLGDNFSPPFSPFLFSRTGGLDFNSAGVLWGTVQRFVVTIDPSTGLATYVDEIASLYDKDALSFSQDGTAFMLYSEDLYTSADLTDINPETDIGPLTLGDDAIAWVFPSPRQGIPQTFPYKIRPGRR